jgi:hypothetical protein
MAHKERAKYGDFLFTTLSKNLLPLFGSGFSYRQLAFFRQFYKTYPNMNALRSHFTWTHYRLLLMTTSKIKRNFYETESQKNNWSSRHLERLINSQLYKRLRLCNNPSKVLSPAELKKINV